MTFTSQNCLLSQQAVILSDPSDDAQFEMDRRLTIFYSIQLDHDATSAKFLADLPDDEWEARGNELDDELDPMDDRIFAFDDPEEIKAGNCGSCLEDRSFSRRCGECETFSI